MRRTRPPRNGERSRTRAVRALFIRHGAEKTPEGRSLRLLRQWLSPVQRAQLAESGYFEVVGGETGRQYRIYAGAATNVCEVSDKGRPKLALCFVPLGELRIGDVMLAQKMALENSEGNVLAVARRFEPNGFMFRRARPVSQLRKSTRRGPFNGRPSPAPSSWARAFA
jgi:hypothetical protein